MGDNVVFRGGEEGQAGYLGRPRGVKRISEEVPKMRRVIGIPETQPAFGGIQKVGVDIFVMSDSAGSMKVGFGDIHRQAREKVCAAIANPLAVLQGVLVCVQKLNPPLNPGVVLHNLDDVLLLLIACKNAGRIQTWEHSKTPDRPHDRASLKFEKSSLTFVNIAWARMVMG